MPILRQVNRSFFKTWSPGMAYVLGLFAADGNMIRNKRGACFIEFQITDLDLLELIRKLLRSNHKIAARKRHEKWKTSYRLQIGSKQIYNDLLGFGFTPNKSKVITLPKIPKEYLSHFVRGYFDGDGNVTGSNYIRANRNKKTYTTILSGFISGSRKFLEQLHSVLKEYAQIKGGTLYHHRGFRLYFSVRDTFALYKFLYNDPKDLFLLRKKKIFEDYFMGP